MTVTAKVEVKIGLGRVCQIVVRWVVNDWVVSEEYTQSHHNVMMVPFTQAF